jgi:hypothetical protein
MSPVQELGVGVTVAVGLGSGLISGLAAGDGLGVGDIRRRGVGVA